MSKNAVKSSEITIKKSSDQLKKESDSQSANDLSHSPANEYDVVFDGNQLSDRQKAVQDAKKELELLSIPN